MPMADATLNRYVERSRPGGVSPHPGGVSPPDSSMSLSEGGLPTHVVLKLAEQAAAGLSHMHKQDVVHNDIHTGNLVLYGARSTDTQHLQVKWADFGRACWAKECGNLNFRPSELFNLSFRPPELLFGGGAHIIAKGVGPHGHSRWHYVNGSGRARNSTASDVWAFGCILMYITKAYTPFRPLDTFQDEVVQQIVSMVNVLGRPRPEIIRSLGWSQMFDNFVVPVKSTGRCDWPSLAVVNEGMVQMLVFDPKQRLSAAQVHEKLRTAS